MKKYEGIMKKYEEFMKKYEEITLPICIGLETSKNFELVPLGGVEGGVRKIRV